MREAIRKGVKLDRRYTYMVAPSEVVGPSAYLFSKSKNFAKDPFYLKHGVRPTLTVYMLQQGADGLDAIKRSASNKEYMKKYFQAIAYAATQSKGTQPIFVIEPDVWGYMLQNARDGGKANLDAVAHINDLGLDWLTEAEFKNQLRDLPKAIIKTIKLHAPDAYAGILIAHWAYMPPGKWGSMINLKNDQDVILAAKGAASFANELLGKKYRGDFMGVEKNGADAGWWRATYGKGTAFDKYYWNDEQNRKWLLWSKTLGKTLDLPLVGWQAPLGHMGLPNTANRYEDTFFPYFFAHAQDFIDAGFIGFMAGSANRGVGTVATVNENAGDNGWFYKKLQEFNKARPYLKKT
jgi:hypothetical protein